MKIYINGRTRNNFSELVETGRYYGYPAKLIEFQSEKDTPFTRKYPYYDHGVAVIEGPEELMHAINRRARAYREECINRQRLEAGWTWLMDVSSPGD